MTRLFLKIALVMVVAVVTSFVVFNAVMASAINRDALAFMGNNIKGTVVLVRERIESTDRRSTPAVLEELNRGFAYPIAVLEPEAVPEEVRAKLGREQYVRFEGTTPATYTWIRNRTQVLKLGPQPSERHTSNRFFLAVGAALCVVLLCGTALVVPVVRRLRAVEQAAGRISEGELGARVKVRSSDAIGQLGSRFNTMASRIESLVSGQRQLLRAVSHELRTPAARMRFSLEMLASSTDDQQRVRHVESLDEDLSELDQLIDELLVYVRFEGEDSHIRLVPIQTRTALTQIVDRLGPMNPGVRIDLEVPKPQPTVIADEKYFRRAAENVLGNALRFAKARVLIEVRVEECYVEVHISDDGPGIPADERERVFEPFARLDESRSRESGGAGLGLAIVQRIMRGHDGSVYATDAPLGGARVVMRWRAEGCC